jgi:hypothetical protein
MYEASHWIVVGVIVTAILLLPRWFSLRTRVIGGAALLPLGITGFSVGLAISDHAFMQSEIIAWAWVITSVLATMSGAIMLIGAFMEWRKKYRPRRKREKWPVRQGS